MNPHTDVAATTLPPPCEKPVPQRSNADEEGWEPIPTPGSEDQTPVDPDTQEVRKRDMPGNPIGPDHPGPVVTDEPPPEFKAGTS